MVYNIFSEGIEATRASRKQPKPSIKAPQQQLHMKSESWLIRISIALVKIILFLYDITSLPIYMILQRPDRRAWEAQRIRSERVDENTWIKTDQNSNELNYLLPGSGPSKSTRVSGCSKQRKYKFMGSTMDEIFANAVELFSERPCLGYRAVVTCPVMVLDDEGKHIMRDKSFRSDYTWYTYDQIGRRVQDIASGLHHYSVYPGTRALFLANTCLEWFIASQACFQLAAQLVVAPEINDGASLRLILDEAEIGIVFVSCDRLRLLSQLFDCIDESSSIRVKKIVIIDWQFSVDFSEPSFAELRKSTGGVVEDILSMGQVEEAGVEHPIQFKRLKMNAQQYNSANGYEVGLNLPNSDQSWAESNNFVRIREGETPPSVHLRRRPINSTKIVDIKGGNDGRNERYHSPSKTRRSTYCKMSPEPSDTGMIVYTHGALGQIRALILTHNYLARCNHYSFFDCTGGEQEIHCATLALDNLIEFMNEIFVFSHGGSIGYSCNPETLFYDGKDLFTRDLSDLQALNPTFLLVRPYILESLRNSIQNYLNLQLNPFISIILANVLYDYKRYWARRHFTTPIVDRLFCVKLRRLFGSQLGYILCNGATDCSETKDFFAFMVNIPVVELYGPDEAIVSLVSVNDIWDYKRRKKSRDRSSYSWRWLIRSDEDMDEHLVEAEDFFDVQLMPPTVNKNTFKEDKSKNLLITSSILCPALGTRIRLEDWEDFRTSDQPYPRGRLIIGGDAVCKGYFKRQELTKESFFTDSNFITWFRTEDLARVFPNGSLEIISGMSDMIKMDDGQFISLSQIEHILRNSQFVDNVCAICGDDRKFVIALVVPNLRRLALKSPGEANLKTAIGPEPEPEELIDIEFRREVCNDRLLSEFVNKHLSELIEKAGFKSIPSRFHLVPEIWVPETELVTPSFEPRRNAIQKYYANDIQSIFKMKTSLTRKRPDEYEDFFGNKVFYFSVEREHKVLTVTVTSEIERIIDKSLEMDFFGNEPWENVKQQLLQLKPEFMDVRQYIPETDMTTYNADIKAYALKSFFPGRPILQAAKDLMQCIFRDFAFVPGFTTIATPLSEVMLQRKGVCQDFAHLAIACVRAMGLPARYVSGYIETLPVPGKQKLFGVDASHAWFSVFLPRIGWVDFDPTNNQIPTNQYLVVGWGRDYADIAPLKGVIVGSGSHHLNVSVDVRRIGVGISQSQSQSQG